MEEKKDFFSLIKTLKKTGYDANSVLYDMCKDDTLFGEESGKLGGKIWLIGRSYAASPERRHYIFDDGFKKESNSNVETNKKGYPKIITTSGDGTANFFEKIEKFSKAADLSEERKAFNEAFDSLKNTKFTFENKALVNNETGEDKPLNDTDKAILNNMVKSVYYFNKILVKAVEKFDDKEGKLKKYYKLESQDINGNESEDKLAEEIYSKVRCKNFISFCSKFLHFHCPKLVFICDGYSLEGGKALFDTKSKKNNNVDIEFCGEKINTKIPAVKFTFETQGKETSKQNPEPIGEIMADYIKHVTHAYSLMKFLYNNKTDKLNNDEIGLTPRLIDNIFLRIKKVGATKH